MGIAAGEGEGSQTQTLGSRKPHSNQKDQLRSLGCSHAWPPAPSSLRISRLGPQVVHSLDTRDHFDGPSGKGSPRVNTEHGGRSKRDQLTHPKGRREECREPGELSHSFVHPSKKYLEGPGSASHSSGCWDYGGAQNRETIPVLMEMIDLDL